MMRRWKGMHCQVNNSITRSAKGNAAGEGSHAHFKCGAHDKAARKDELILEFFWHVSCTKSKKNYSVLPKYTCPPPPHPNKPQTDRLIVTSTQWHWCQATASKNLIGTGLKPQKDRFIVIAAQGRKFPPSGYFLQSAFVPCLTFSDRTCLKHENPCVRPSENGANEQKSNQIHFPV
eukprot:1137216-Pelagomonas_calceolata.AAC.7